MNRIARLCTLATLMGMMASGCYESAFPLDPSPKAALDPKLLSTWRCLSTDAEEEAVSMIVGRAREGVYAVNIQERGQDPDKYEAHASIVSGSTLLNIREMKETSKPWVFGRYVLLRPNVLQMQIVSDDALKGVEASPAAVRRAIERRRNDPGLFVDGFTCVRAKETK